VVNSQNTDFRSHFAATASVYRKRNLQLWLFSVPVVLVFWYLVFLGPSAVFLGLLFFIVAFAALFLDKRTLPKLICPACELDTDGEIVRFCPECGSADLQTKGDDKSPTTCAKPAKDRIAEGFFQARVLQQVEFAPSPLHPNLFDLASY
jgi:hypothetical protein